MPEGIVDVIPVDLVVAAIIAVAAKGPEPDIRGHAGRVRLGRTRCATAASSTSSPSWFTEHPLYDAKGQPIVVPEWSFPGRGRVQGQLQRAQSLLNRAERRARLAAPAGQAGRVERRARGEARGGRAGPRLRRALRRLRRVRGRLRPRPAARPVGRARPPTTSATSASTPASSTGTASSTEIHLPSVVDQSRVRTTPGGRTGPTRERAPAQAGPRPRAPAGGVRPREHADRLATWWPATPGSPPAACRPTSASASSLQTLAEGPSLLALDRKDRSDFLRIFYRRYDGAPVDQIAEDSAEMFSRLIIAKSFPAAIRRVREHRAAGHRTVLITGALDFVVKPLEPALRRHRRRRDGRQPTAPTTASSPTCRPPARAGPRC